MSTRVVRDVFVRPAFLLSALILAASCGTAAPPTGPATSPSPLVTDGPTINPTSAPAPTAITPAPSVAQARPLPEEHGDVPAGSYTSSTLGPTITFNVGDGFSTSGDVPEAGFDLRWQDSGAPAAVTVTTFDGEYFADPCDPEAGMESTGDTSAEDFMAFLAARDGVVVEQEPVPISVGGHEGLLIDVRTELPPECAAEPPEWIFLWTVPVFGDFHFADAETARVIAVDVDEQVIVVVIEAYPDVDWAAFVELSMAIVESMEIEPAS